MCPDFAIEAAYFAAALARELASRRSDPDETPVLLVDGQPGTGGLDVVVDLESAPGVRWRALRGVGGEVDGVRLLGALPSRDGVAVLSHGRGDAGNVTPEVSAATLKVLAHHVQWQIRTTMPPVTQGLDVDDVLLLVRGTVCGMAAAQQCCEALEAAGGRSVSGVIAVETAGATRAAMEEALGAPLLAAAPVRWRLSAAAATDVLEGRWPGASDRTMRRLVTDTAVYLRSEGRCLAWA